MLIVAIVLVVLLALGLAWMISMPGRSHGESLPPLDELEAELAQRLEGHVEALAGGIGERNYKRTSRLDAARDYVEAALRDCALDPLRQEFEVDGSRFANVEAEIKGASAPKEVVIFGAHYDSVLACPGADDNASGVAALLELARLSSTAEYERTVRFVAFANEEPPFFPGDQMGSAFYAGRCRERGEDIVAMLSIESIAYFADAAGSQRYPPPFSFFYPNRGHFIAFVANLSSRSLVRRMIRAFREHATIPSEGLAAPSLIPGVSWSDQLWFWRHGYPAAMVTDTAPFRNPHYHTPHDTPTTLDYERCARVVAGLRRILDDLAARRFR